MHTVLDGEYCTVLGPIGYRLLWRKEMVIAVGNETGNY